jgi:amino acid transporter
MNFWFAVSTSPSVSNSELLILVKWVMIIPAEITAANSMLQFWPETNVIPLAAYITIFIIIIGLGNTFHVRIYGYIEYYMSFIKCLAVILLVFFMFIITSGGITATNGPIEFTYWTNPGAFKNGIKGIAKAFVQAAFSFGGGMILSPRIC